jgi:hypothetical protein
MHFWAMVALLAAMAFIGILGWTIFRSSTYVDRIRRSRFAGRTPLDDNSFYERYYSSSGLRQDIVAQMRHEIETALRIPAQTLLPTDRFSTELSVVRGWEYTDDGPDELFLLNRDREKRLGVQIPLAELKTVDDYIRTVGAFELRDPTHLSR